MGELSISPERHSFQINKAIARAEEKKDDTAIDVITMWEKMIMDTRQKEQEPDWQKNNMENDLRSTEWILEKTRTSNSYAQNLYAAMCNREFVQNAVWPLLKDQRWSCSWRSAGGIIADMQEKGDYIDWYCSGIRDTYKAIDDEQFSLMSKEQQEYYITTMKYVGEGTVTDEIKADLLTLGWIVLDDGD